MPRPRQHRGAWRLHWSPESKAGGRAGLQSPQPCVLVAPKRRPSPEAPCSQLRQWVRAWFCCMPDTRCLASENIVTVLLCEYCSHHSGYPQLPSSQRAASGRDSAGGTGGGALQSSLRPWFPATPTPLTEPPASPELCLLLGLPSKHSRPRLFPAGPLGLQPAHSGWDPGTGARERVPSYVTLDELLNFGNLSKKGTISSTQRAIVRLRTIS